MAAQRVSLQKQLATLQPWTHLQRLIVRFTRRGRDDRRLNTVP